MPKLEVGKFKQSIIISSELESRIKISYELYLVDCIEFVGLVCKEFSLQPSFRMKLIEAINLNTNEIPDDDIPF